jgi:signal peptidase I
MVLRAYGPFATHALEGEAMAPGLRAGDVVLADQPRAACGETAVQQGDVVIYRRGADLYPARAIAGPGQTLWMTDGGPVVDGRAIDRRLLGSEPAAGLTVRAALLQEALPGGRSWRVHDLETGGGLDAIAPVTVPAGTWYLLGDNRDNAVDSRTHGPVRTQDICAVAVKILSAKDPARVGLQP